ncbi:TPA: GTP cyclohydrolase II, partial [Campylobacter coli]|nr:GTP cyclohydrolase II [Campylobacter coli]
YGISKVNLLTNNPKKLDSIKEKIITRIPILIEPNRFNAEYLNIKQIQMGHLK